TEASASSVAPIRRIVRAGTPGRRIPSTGASLAAKNDAAGELRTELARSGQGIEEGFREIRGGRFQSFRPHHLRRAAGRRADQFRLRVFRKRQVDKESRIVD